MVLGPFRMIKQNLHTTEWMPITGTQCICTRHIRACLRIGRADGYVRGCRYNNQLLQLTVSCLYLAAIVGALASELARPLGRKVSPYLYLVSSIR